MRGVNLTPVIMLPVNWTKQPEITPQIQLHLPGIVPSQPLQLKLNLQRLRSDDALLRRPSLLRYFRLFGPIHGQHDHGREIDAALCEDLRKLC